jgi:SAM-dependent methyltransferase
VVLDVGSGHSPCPRAHVLADAFPDDLAHRAEALVEDRPVIVCSVERLPFRDAAFDFAVCSHVLEHVASPARGAAELGRVAREGFIETPAYGRDILVGTGHQHRWQVVAFDDHLHFFEYTRRQREGHVTSPVMDIWCSETHHPWQDFFWERQDLFNAQLLFRSPPAVTEHRRAERASLLPWTPVPPESLRAAACALSATEIALLETRLVSLDDGGPVRFDRERGAFVGPGRCVYPVRGKRVWVERLAPGTDAGQPCS